MLPVMLASADAKDKSPRCSCLPHSFSVTENRSPEAIDITAALARCAMSRTESPAVLFGSGGGTAGGGTFIATCAGAACFGLGASATFGALTVFGASLGASANFGATGCCDGAMTGSGGTADATACGCEAANRSLNIKGVIDATVAGSSITGAVSCSAANVSPTASATLRVATIDGRLMTGSS